MINIVILDFVTHLKFNLFLIFYQEEFLLLKIFKITIVFKVSIDCIIYLFI